MLICLQSSAYFGPHNKRATFSQWCIMQKLSIALTRHNNNIMCANSPLIFLLASAQLLVSLMVCLHQSEGDVHLVTMALWQGFRGHQVLKTFIM